MTALPFLTLALCVVRNTFVLRFLAVQLAAGFTGYWAAKVFILFFV